MKSHTYSTFPDLLQRKGGREIQEKAENVIFYNI